MADAAPGAEKDPGNARREPVAGARQGCIALYVLRGAPAMQHSTGDAAMVSDPNSESTSQSQSARDTSSALAAANAANTPGGVAESSAPALEVAPLPVEQVAAIVQSRHDAPHRILGPHPAGSGKATVIRAFLPYAEAASVRIHGTLPFSAREHSMRRIDDEGLFEVTVPLRFGTFNYQMRVDSDPTVGLDDPYRFRTARFDADDERRFLAGRHLRLSEKLGAWATSIGDTEGVAFAIWAPNARRVSVVGTFNRWDGRLHPMQRVTGSGIWELFIPGIAVGELYKFEIKTPTDVVFLKTDLFARATEVPPATAAIIEGQSDRVWQDDAWTNAGRTAAFERGVCVRPLESALLTGDHAALIETILGEGYNAVELTMPPSAGDTASLLAVGPGCGGSEGVASFVEACHRHGVAVVLQSPGNLVPAGIDDLAWYDGTRLYESEPVSPGGPRGTPLDEPLRFDLQKGEVRSVLLSRVAYWLDRFHIDALSCSPDEAGMWRDLLADDRFRGLRLIISDPEAPSTLATSEMARLVAGRHADPYGMLGAHSIKTQSGTATSAVGDAGPGTVVRVLQPGARDVQLLADDQPQIIYRMRPINPAGLFEVCLPAAPSSYRLRVFEAGGEPRDLVDGYALRDFTFTLDDQRLFGEGNHYRIFDKLGAHARRIGDVEGVTFAVWAPEAEGVSVVGPFNRWDGRAHLMQRHGLSGVWEVFIPGLGEGELYKFEVRARNGHTFLKTDPYAFFTEVPPATASVVTRIEGVHDWQDHGWIERRSASKPWQQPIAIYEVHLGSWMRAADGSVLSYRELAAKLVSYVKALGFTHIELLPIAEHPYEPSWGYQVSNFYAPTSRFGSPADLMAFIDQCHAEDIGVILDWVPGHFPKDAHALAWFDGTHVYEHADPRKGEHPDWGTLIFNYGRHEVENFLIANALFWLEIYHFDGLRVDAVASMLYLDYSRPASGGWIPNAYGGKENLEAIEFLKHTNSILHARFPGILMIAEESTSWPNVSRPAYQGGIGFGFKWNMGWMHDVLAYMSVPASERKWHHGRLTFGLMYAFDENFILSLSHDEVVHLKRSLYGKMPGEEWEKFANLRLLFTLMYAHPGKKLLFMGGELGQESEWNHSRSLDWRLLEKKANRSLQWFFQDLNRLYREPALHEQDFRSSGFEWLEVDNGEESILAFLRKARDPRDAVVFAANFGAISRPGHRIGVPFPTSYRELFDSNSVRYGGYEGRGERRRLIQADEIPWHGREFSISIDLPAMSAVVLKPAPLQID